MSFKGNCLFCFKSSINAKSSISDVNTIKFLCKQLNVDFSIFEKDSTISTETLEFPLCNLCNDLYVQELVTIYGILQKVKGQLKILISNITKKVSASYEQEQSEKDAIPQTNVSTLFRDEVIRSAHVLVKLEPEEEFDDIIGDEVNLMDDIKAEAILGDIELNADNINLDHDVYEMEDGAVGNSGGSDAGDSSSTSESDGASDSNSDDSSSTSESQELTESEDEDYQPFRKKVKLGASKTARKRKCCRFCKYKSIYPSKIRKHEVETHPDQLTHPCCFCLEKYSSSLILEIHMNTHAHQGPYSCSICEGQPQSELFPTAESMENHLVLYHIPKEPRVTFPISKGNLPCKTCGRVFQTAYSLKKHNESQHSNKTHKLTCELCPEVSLTQLWMANHAAQCHEKVESIKTFVCAKCPKKFVTNFMFERHMKRHKMEHKKPFGCEICESSFAIDNNKPGGLKYHMKIKHQEEQKRRYECRDTGCNRSFGIRGGRNQHEREKHPELLIYCCTLCDKVYQEKEFLDTHVKVHGDEEPPFTCESCKYSFVTRDILAEHLLSHTGERRLNCSQCPKLFRYQKDLEQHVLSAHTGEKPHECEVCKKRFANKSKLKSHFEVHHGGPDGNGQKIFCDMCDKWYSTNIRLTIHKNRDHGLGEYKRETKVICDICGKSISKSFLKTHIKLHEGTVELKEICTFCGKGFRTGFELKQHTFTHTGEKPYTCHICLKGFTQGHSWKSHLKVHQKNGTYKDP